MLCVPMDSASSKSWKRFSWSVGLSSPTRLHSVWERCRTFTTEESPRNWGKLGPRAVKSRYLRSASDPDSVPIGSVSDICVRLARLSDRDQLVRMFETLWPKTPAEEHARELTLILEGKPPVTMPLIILVAEASDGMLVGFLQVDLRSHATAATPPRPGMRWWTAVCTTARPCDMYPDTQHSVIKNAERYHRTARHCAETLRQC
jgi:hypothetical protein